LKSMTKAHWFALLIVWAISIGYMATHLKRGWVPSDEGYLGQTAERVLHGELPHRDFDETYTGGMTFLHAFAFRELGTNLGSLRIILFAFFVAWVPAVFYVASRFASACAAGGVTLLALAWSVPNYPAAVPSWYNLFFATFGAAALLRYLEVHSRRWVFLAGVCAGISILAKITGLYFFAGVLLFFVFCEQGLSRECSQKSSDRARFYTTTIVSCLILFLILLFRLIHKLPELSFLTYFFVPSVALVIFLVARECAGIPSSDHQRFSNLLDPCLPFVIGTAIPPTAFFLLFAHFRAVHALLYGVFTLPMKRFVFAVMPPHNPILMAEMIPFFVPVLLASECGRLGRMLWGGILTTFLVLVLVFSRDSTLLYGLGWRSLTTAIPALILAGVLILGVSRSGQRMTLLRKQEIMLLLCVTALTSIVQFPWADPIYNFYVAPLEILTAVALCSSMNRPPKLTYWALGAFYFLFVIFRVSPGFIPNMGVYFAPDMQVERLTIARAGGLRVTRVSAASYEELVSVVQSHAIGRFIYATSDCPEVYFLSGLENPTRTFTDEFDEPSGRTERILQTLAEKNVSVVAINHMPGWSPMPEPILMRALKQRYPHSARIGRFEVRWKEI